MIAFIPEDSKVIRCLKLEPEAVDSICLDVMDSRKSRFIVCAYYRSPKFCKVPDFISALTSATELIYRSRRELLLLRDFNTDMTNDESVGRRADSNLTDFCDKFCLHNQRKELTRSSGINVIRNVTQPVLLCIFGVSDHDLVYVMKRTNCQDQNHVKLNIEVRRDLVRSENDAPWDSAYIFDNVDDQ